MKILLYIILLAVVATGVYIAKRKSNTLHILGSNYDWRSDPEVWEYHRNEINKIKEKYGNSVSSLFENENGKNSEEIFYDLQTLCSWKRLNGNELSRIEEVILNIPGIGMEVRNGGFHQYFFNSAGDDWEVIYFAMKESGDYEGLERFKKVLAIFPSSKPSPIREERWKQLDALGEEKQYEVFEMLDKEFFNMPFPNFEKIWGLKWPRKTGQEGKL